MRCAYCGGTVLWVGPLSQLSCTECQDCGRTNCQELDAEFEPAQEPEEQEFETWPIEPSKGGR